MRRVGNLQFNGLNIFNVFLVAPAEMPDIAEQKNGKL